MTTMQSNPTDSEEISPYAWMSVRDGEIIHELLSYAASKKKQPLRVLEWGAGKSTVSYASLLNEELHKFEWTALEYNRAFFDNYLVEELKQFSNFTLKQDTVELKHAQVTLDGGGVINALCWNSGELKPFLGDEYRRDRLANLDDYVDFPLDNKPSFDVYIVDGRKRRRCLLAANAKMQPGSIVILHDAFRDHYKCAMSSFTHCSEVGDELWLAADTALALESILDFIKA